MSTIRISNLVRVMKFLWVLICPMSSCVRSDIHGTFRPLSYTLDCRQGMVARGLSGPSWWFSTLFFGRVPVRMSSPCEPRGALTTPQGRGRQVG